jgi:flagellar motor switch protein FliN/FliY
MTAIHSIPVELTVILGRTTMPVQKLLRMGRGAVISLDNSVDDEVEITVNDKPIAKGEVMVDEARIEVSITSKITRNELVK